MPMVVPRMTLSRDWSLYCDLGDVRAHVLGQAGELIYEGDLHGQEGVGGVLDQFRTGGGGG